MSNELQRVVNEALSLDRESRGVLVDKLIVSLAQEPEFLDEWLTEAERRLEE